MLTPLDGLIQSLLLSDNTDDQCHAEDYDEHDGNHVMQYEIPHSDECMIQ